MHAWEGRPFDDVARLCIRRDPRRYPIGCLTAAPGAEAEVVQWFRHAGELAAFLWRMEPQRWGLRLAELAEFKTRVEPVIIQLDVVGLHEALRADHNRLSQAWFEVRWWGAWDQVRSGTPSWVKKALEETSDPEEILLDEDRLISHLRDRSLRAAG